MGFVPLGHAPKHDDAQAFGLHYVHSASLAYKDGSVFMSMAHGTRYGTKVLKSETWTT